LPAGRTHEHAQPVPGGPDPRSAAARRGHARPLNTLCGSIQFQDVARQQLEQVSRALSMISDHFVALSGAIIHDGAPPDSSIAACLKLDPGSYVMEQQRAAHGQIRATAPKIELF
jgi:hypothetical protein